MDEMKPIQQMIQKAHDGNLLRHSTHDIVWDVDRPNYQFELRRSSMSGVEFGYCLIRDEITWATRSVDGEDVSPDEFLIELIHTVSPATPDS